MSLGNRVWPFIPKQAFTIRVMHLLSLQAPPQGFRSLAYLSDRFWYPLDRTGCDQLCGCVQGDLMANRHIHRVGGTVGGPQGLDRYKEQNRADM